MTDVLDRPAVDVAPTAASKSGTRFDLSAGARLLLASFSVGAGAIHLAMVPSHWGSSTVEGVSFAVVGWLQIAFAVAVMARPSRLLLQLGIALNAIAIGAWIVSRTAGLPYGAHSGVAEDAGFVDVTCVVLEGVLLLACAVWAFKPGLGARFAKGGLAFAAIVAVSVLGLTTAALASPGARNHGHDDSGAGGVAADGHAHGHGEGEPDATPVDDKGFSQLSNGQHAHMTTLHELDAGTQKKLDEQLNVTREVAKLTPTVAAAEKAGYKRVGPYLPGIGAHYWKGLGANGGLSGPSFNPSGHMDDAALRNPLMLIFNGTKPNSEIAGFMYYSASPFEPDGFAGRNDTWHYHEKLCLKQLPDGGVDVPYGLDHGATKAQCDKAGGFILPMSNYMVHVWSVPGYEMQARDGGIFGESHRKLACADGSYYTLPLDEWIDHPLNACKSQ
jgi:hypothetical protein